MKGDDLIEGGKGNDELYGGDDADTFVYTLGDGDDTIFDYNLEDKLHFVSGTPKFKKNGNDYIITVKNGSTSNTITLKDAADKIITYIDAKGVQRFYPNDLRVEDDDKTVTLLEGYAKTSFDLANYIDELQTVNASAVTHDMTIAGNAKANKIIGTDEDDVIDGGAGKDTILGGDGNDSINGGKGNDSLIGGKGNDVLTGGSGADKFVFALGYGKDTITDYEEADKIQFTSYTITEDQYSYNGNDLVFKLNKSNVLTVKDAANKTLTYVDDDGEHTLATVMYNAKGTAATLLSTYSDSLFSAAESEYPKTLKNINATAVEHDITITGNGLANKIIGTDQNDVIDGGAGADLINGGAGNDSLNGDAGNDTLNGGKGNDKLTGGTGEDVFVYALGYGKDTITDYEAADKIQFTSGVITDEQISYKNSDVIFTLNKSNVLTVKDAANKTLTYVDEDGVHTISTVMYNAKGTAATLTANYSADMFNAAESEYPKTLKNIDASAVEHEIIITGNEQANKIIGGTEDDYLDGGKAGDTLAGGKGNDTLVGGKGNDSLKGGSGADVFIYKSGDGNDTIADYKEEDVIQFTSGTVAVKTDGNNVIFIVTNGKTTGNVTVEGGKDHVITYVDSEGEQHIFPEKTMVINNDGTAVTLKKNYVATTFDVNTNAYVVESEYSDHIETINSSAVTHKIKLIGNDNANSIKAGKSNDTLIGGKGNDTLFGGAGQDVFVYNVGDGKDVIEDYTEGEDVINIASGTIKTISTKTNGNVVFTVKEGKTTGTITVKDGKDKVITYKDADGKERQYPVPWVVDGENVTLTDKYIGNSFKLSDHDELKGVYNIQAGAVPRGLTIEGDKNANYIYGSAGDNTIIGGKGSDTLNGGSGANTYIYKNGDGNDLIIGFGSDDTLRIASGTLSGDVRVNGDTVIFSIGSGKVSLSGAANKPITYWYDGEYVTDSYSAQNVDVSYLLDDEDDFSGADNQLSSIIRDGAAGSYSTTRLDDTFNFAAGNSSLPALTYSGNK